MTWRGTLRSIQAAARAAERDSRRRQRELERHRQAIHKANEFERAAFEVEVYRNRIEQLVSVHRDGSTTIDWQKISKAAPPDLPQRSTAHEDSARRNLEVYQPSFFTRLLKRAEKQRTKLEVAIEAAREKDEVRYSEARALYDTQHSEWREQKELAERILRGDPKAYIEAIKELNPFGEISDLGSSVGFNVVNPQLVTADIEVHGETAVPRETKSLLKSGKLSVKQTPKGDFYRLYQDYICSCTLRVARELFALLPIETVVVSALDNLVNSATGHLEKQPILSVFVPRDAFKRLNLGLVDPSDSMKNFVHQMDFKVTSGFRPVERVSTEGMMHTG